MGRLHLLLTTCVLRRANVSVHANRCNVALVKKARHQREALGSVLGDAQCTFVGLYTVTNRLIIGKCAATGAGLPDRNLIRCLLG